MYDTIRCAYCNASLAGVAPIPNCPNCGAYLTGIRCEICRRVGSERNFIGEMCPDCHRAKLAAGIGARSGAAVQRPEKTSLDVCKACGRSKDKNDWTCPYCGNTQWGDVAVMGVLALVCAGGVAFGWQLTDPLWHPVVMWVAGILGGILVAITVGEVVGGVTKGAARRRAAQQGPPTWTPRGSEWDASGDDDDDDDEEDGIDGPPMRPASNPDDLSRASGWQRRS